MESDSSCHLFDLKDVPSSSSEDEDDDSSSEIGSHIEQDDDLNSFIDQDIEDYNDDADYKSDDEVDGDGDEMEDEKEENNKIGNEDGDDKTKNNETADEKNLNDEKKKEDMNPLQLAKLIAKGDAGVPWNEAEQFSSKNSSENTKKYEKDKRHEFENFLKIIADNGGPHFEKLCGAKPVENEYGQKIPLIISFLKQVPDLDSYMVILDEMIKIYVMRVRQVESDKDYAPSSMETKLKRILTFMHTTYKVPRVTLSDFAASGSFRSMLAEKWQDIREKNPDFGITKGMSDIVFDDIQIVNKAIKDGKLKPYEDPYHCLLLVVFTLLRIFAYRPNDVKMFNKKNMTFGTYIDGELKGETYMQCQVWFDKVTKLKLGKTQLDRTYGTAKVYDNSKDKDFYFKPVQLFLFYSARRPQRKNGNDQFLCHPTRKRNFNKDADPWFKDANVGENWISSVYKRIGEIIDNEDFKKVTGHGGRASFITHALLDKVNPQAIIAQTRHASFNALQNYARNVDQGASQLQLSLFADKHIPASGTSSTKVYSSANAATRETDVDSKPSSIHVSSANAATRKTDVNSNPSSIHVSSANAATRETDTAANTSSTTVYSSANAATKPDYSSPKRKKPMSTIEELTPKTKAIRKLEEKLSYIEKEKELQQKKQTKLKLHRLKKEKEKLQLENDMLKRTQQTQQPPPLLHYQHSPYFPPSMPYHQVHPPHLHHPPPPPPPPPQYYYHQPDERRKNNCTIS